MAETNHPFIDIAVLPGVRERFARGEALVLFSADLSGVLWANGAGARLFGRPLIYDLIEEGPDRSDVAFRQIAATAGQLLADGDRRGLMVRIGSGFRAEAIRAEIERLHLNDDEAAILFSAPQATGGPLSSRAAAMLSGFDDEDFHMAVIGEGGTVLAASPDFARLGIDPLSADEFASLARRSRDGLVKRQIRTARGYLPAAIGTLSRDPELHLLLCVETLLGRMDPPEDDVRTQAPAATDEAVTVVVAPIEVQADHAEARPLEDDGVAEAAVTAIAENDVSGTEAVSADDDVLHPNVDVMPDVAETETDVDGVEQDFAGISSLDARDSDEPAGEPVDEWADIPDTIDHAEMVALDSVVPDIEETQPAAAMAPDEPTETPAFRFNRTGRPVRFVWKIDADGLFSEVSDDFAATVGPDAANVAGLSFRDIAALFRLDPEGKITDLLSRRDTWSGRTVLWPVQGTDLVVPIDLAALPTYSKNRDFDGFRGFGIIRVADAEHDPHEMGLLLGDTAQAPAVIEPGPDENPGTLHSTDDGDDITLTVDEQFRHLDHDADAFDPDDPFRGERPALVIDRNPGRRFSDKIIQLEERRGRSREGLTPGEQEAFRQIARQLEPFGKRPNELLLGRDGDDSAENTDVPIQDGIAPEGIIPDADSDAAPETFVSKEHDDQASVSAVDLSANPDDDAAREIEGRSEEIVEDLLPVASPVESDAAVADVLESTAADDAVADTGSVEAADTETPVEDAPDQVDDFPAAANETPLAATAPDADALTPALLEQMPVALLVHAGEKLIHANSEFLRLTGYRDLDELRSAGGLDALMTRGEGAEGPDAQVYLVTADDRIQPVAARLQSVRFVDQTALMLMVVPQGEAPVAALPLDVGLDARYRSLKVEADELRTILETATDGVVLLSQDGTMRSMNRSASALFNFENDEIRGRPFAMLFAHESQKAVMDYLAGLSGHGVASVLNDGREVIGREANGGFIPLFMTMGRLNQSSGFCAVIRDITQWKRSEEELKAAKRAAETANAHKSDFLAKVSHEIRTPLNAIIGFADMMAAEHFGPMGHSRYVEYAHDIGRSGRHVLDIVNDLLDISKIEAGEMELDFAAVTLNDCLSEAVSIIQPQANAQRVIIRTALSADVPDIVADLRSIKQIALNILANAIKFTPSGGQVVVSTAYEANGSVVLKIRDTGIGMSRSELEQAMKPFRQVTSGKARRGDGTGLGLPLTKAMVEANRANFMISSQPNEGTLVEITFPSQRVLAD